MSIKELEKILKAVANRRRLAIVKFLKENREVSVGDIAREIKLSFRATSKHLVILSAVDITEKDQRGLQVFHRLAKESKPLMRHLVSMI